MSDILNNKKLLITGEQVFIKRYYLLINELQKHFNGVELLNFPPVKPSKRRFITDLRNRFPYLKYFTNNVTPPLTDWAFDYRSGVIRKKVAEVKPDIVLQIFGQACSVKNDNLPFAMSLDYTVALAEKSFPEKRFSTPKHKQKWMEKERLAYERATYLFAWSNLVAQSLQNDYGIDAKKIIVTGSGGNLQDVYPGEKKFGNKHILFNGSDFYRKGGDILIEAFKKVHADDPATKLFIVGVEGTNTGGVFYQGDVDKNELKKLFEECDIVVAPARCDPFPGFLIEAMQFGLPCIVSDKDGMPEIVDDGQTGIVLKRLSPTDLAEAITELLNNKKLLVDYSKAAQNRVRSTLNWNYVTNKIVSAFQSSFQ